MRKGEPPAISSSKHESKDLSRMIVFCLFNSSYLRKSYLHVHEAFCFFNSNGKAQVEFMRGKGL